MTGRRVPRAVFLPPVAEPTLDLDLWPPNDKHLVLDFLAPDSPRALALATAVSA